MLALKVWMPTPAARSAFIAWDWMTSTKGSTPSATPRGEKHQNTHITTGQWCKLPRVRCLNTLKSHARRRFLAFKGEKYNLWITLFIYPQQMEYSRNGIPSTSFSKYGSSCRRGGPCWEIHPAHHQDWPTAAWRYVRQQTHQAVVKTEELG